jgi:hypothetical protein
MQISCTSWVPEISKPSTLPGLLFVTKQRRVDMAIEDMREAAIINEEPMLGGEDILGE